MLVIVKLHYTCHSILILRHAWEYVRIFDGSEFVDYRPTVQYVLNIKAMKAYESQNSEHIIRT